MSRTIDSRSDTKPNSQDLEDILIDQLPENTEEQRFYKEAWTRFSIKLKEIFDYYDTGNLVGAQGPRGPQGPAGPPGSGGGGGGGGEDFCTISSNRILVGFDTNEHEQVLLSEDGFVLCTEDLA
jgi:hypothetical protein